MVAVLAATSAVAAGASATALPQGAAPRAGSSAPHGSASAPHGSATHGSSAPPQIVNGLPVVIPQPVSETARGGPAFLVNPATRIVLTGRPRAGIDSVTSYLAGLLKVATGRPVRVTRGSDRSGDAIVLDESGRGVSNAQGYTLRSGAKNVVITASTAQGLYFGVQTLRQLLPAAIETQIGTHIETQQGHQRMRWTVPAVSISDAPRYSYRSVMIDTARHFYPVAAIERVIDQASMYKLDNLHLHLSDDQGWRIAVQAYPDLTTIGSNVDQRPGFYTAADYEQIVRYAAAHFMTVVPEIDGPAHTTAAVTAMATGTDPNDIPIDPLNPADNANVATFLDKVTADIAAMSPAPYYHIGGDESSAPVSQYDNWVTAAGDAANANGKIAMGWNEIGQDPDLPGGSVLEYWGADTTGIATGLANGDKLLMAPEQHAYFDHKYDANTPLGLEGFVPLSAAYEWDPGQLAATLPGGSDSDVLGVEAPLWADTVPPSFNLTQTEGYADFMLLPRIPALAEVGWSPTSVTDADGAFTNFAERVGFQGLRWQALGYGFYQTPEVPWQGLPPLAPGFTSLVAGSALSVSPTSLSGTGTVVGDTITVTDAGAQVCTATVAADGTWTCAVASPLSGTVTLSATESNSFGTSPATTITVTIGSAPALVDSWTMNQSSGTTVPDAGPGGFPGTVTGSTTFVAGPTAGTFAAAFDGSTSPITTTAGELATPWSIGAWVMPGTVDVTVTGEVLIGDQNAALKPQQFGSGQVGATQYGVADNSVGFTLTPGVWTFLTYVDDGTQIDVYANGNPVGSIAASFPLPRADIGVVPTKDTGAGDLADITVYSNALTPDQVTSLFNGGPVS